MVQLSSLLAFTATALSTLTLAADITGYRSARCQPNRLPGKVSSVACIGIADGKCCNFGFDAESIKWTLPKTSTGVAYQNMQCNQSVHMDLRANLTPLTNVCKNYPHARSRNVVVRSAKWADDKKKVMNVKRLSTDPECEEPNVIVYYDGHEGSQMMKKKVPVDQYQQCLEWLAKGDYEKLSELEDYIPLPAPHMN